MNQYFKEIEGTEGFYFVNCHGDVLSLKSGAPKILKPHIQEYATVRIRVNGDKSKKKKVHRFVAKCFVPNPDNKLLVNHIDGNKLNNKAENLEWVTGLENAQHAKRMGLYLQGGDNGQAKHSNEQVIALRQFRKDFPKVTLKDIAWAFRINYNTLLDIIYNKHWKEIQLESICNLQNMSLLTQNIENSQNLL